MVKVTEIQNLEQRMNDEMKLEKSIKKIRNFYDGFQTEAD